MAGKARICTYYEDERRCRRRGTGNPCLCEEHRSALEIEAARPRRPGERIMGVVLGALFGDAPTDDELYEAAEEAATLLQGNAAVRARAAAAAAAAQRMWQARQAGRSAPGARRQPPRPSSPPPPPPSPDIDARAVLGFTPREHLTVERVKARHRELVRKHHPDRGGSTSRMAEVNAAVDVLLAHL